MSSQKSPQESLFLRRGISLGNMMKERDDDLALFHDIRKRDSRFSGNLLLPVSEEFDAVFGGDKISSSPLCKIPEATPKRRGGSDDFLTADGDKSDYSWLLTPPGTPLFPSLEMEARAKGFEQHDIPVVRPLAAIKTSRLSKSEAKSTLKNAKAGLTEHQTTSSYTVAKKSSETTAKSSPSSRSSTPSSRSSISAYKPLSTSAKRSSQPARQTATSYTASKKPSATAKSPPSSRSSTPSSRSSVSAYKPLSTSAKRSSQPARQTATSDTAAKKPSATAKSPPSSRSSTPSSRSSVSAHKPLSKSAQHSSTPGQWSSTTGKQSTIPAQRSSTPAQQSSTSAQKPSRTAQKSSSPRLTQNNTPGRSSSVSKVSTVPSRNSALSRGSSPTAKTRPLQPSSVAAVTLETPPNLRTDMPGRSASANRDRRRASSSEQSNTIVPTSSNKPRRQSCSPSVTRGRVSNGSLTESKSSLTANKNSNGVQGAMPAVVGSKMVEKLMNARRYTHPGKVEEASDPFVGSTLATKMSVKSVLSQPGDGFGRTISKKSLDMALRHMDIRGSMGSSMRSHMKNIPASSLYSVRSGAIKSKSSGISRSPTATSSIASSESSTKISPDPDVSKFDDDEFGSDKESKSSRASWQDSLHFKGDAKSTNWLLGEETTEDRDEQSLISDQGFEMLSDPMDDVARALTAFEYDNDKIGTNY